MIVKGRGTHFDPAVVDAFQAIAPLFRQVSDEAHGTKVRLKPDTRRVNR